MALGMDRTRVIALFTVEGAMHGVLALGAGAVYGIPLLALTLAKGIPVPQIMSDMGMPVPHILYPSYGLRLVVVTTLLVLVSVTVVSMLPASNIAKLKPTDALKGKAT
jgi:putative ABC transport system permease protein